MVEISLTDFRKLLVKFIYYQISKLSAINRLKEIILKGTWELLKIVIRSAIQLSLIEIL